MLEFRKSFTEDQWVANIKTRGLEFVITSVERREKEAFLLDIYQWHTSTFNNVYKTYDRAKIKANALYKVYKAQDEEE